MTRNGIECNLHSLSSSIPKIDLIPSKYHSESMTDHQQFLAVKDATFIIFMENNVLHPKADKIWSKLLTLGPRVVCDPLVMKTTWEDMRDFTWNGTCLLSRSDNVEKLCMDNSDWLVTRRIHLKLRRFAYFLSKATTLMHGTLKGQGWVYHGD